MSKRENDVNNIFRPSDSGLTEYEKEQIALRKNLERLKVERLAREAEIRRTTDRSARRADATERAMRSAVPVEEKCQACDGAAYQAVKQPSQPNHRIFPSPCKECGGKGRITKS